MRSISFRNVVGVAATALLLVGCAALPYRADMGQNQVNRAADRVMSAYDMAALLARADTVLTRSLMAALPETVNSRRRARLKQIIDARFSTDTLVAGVRRQLAGQALDTDHTHALAKAADALATPLARRLRRLQQNVGDDGFAAGYNAFVQQSRGPARKARRQQINTLIRHMAVIDLQGAFHTVLLGTMLKTRNAVTQPEQDIPLPQINDKLAKSRRMLRDELREQLPPILLYVYHGVGDATLQKYVRMQSSPPLIWTNRALVVAIRRTLEQAGELVRKEAKDV